MLMGILDADMFMFMFMPILDEDGLMGMSGMGMLLAGTCMPIPAPA